MKRLKRCIAGLLAGATIFSLAGCSQSSLLSEDVRSYPLVAALTESELRDYYVKSLDFDTNIVRNIEVDETKYETRDITSTERQEWLLNAVGNTTAIMHLMEFNYTDAYPGEYGQYCDEETFHYIKSFLNDKTLELNEIVSITEALGYYFITMEYNVTPREPGEFTGWASLVGLNGAMRYSDYYDEDMLETSFLKMAVEKLNEYYEENKISSKLASFDPVSGIFSMDPNEIAGSNLDFTQSTASDNPGDFTDLDSQPIDSQPDVTTGEPTDTDGETIEPVTTEPPVSTNPQISDTSAVLSIRTPGIDVKEFNEIVGSSSRQAAYMPKLEKVYTIPAAEGSSSSLSGIGIYPSGIGGMTKFQFNRSKMDGTVRLRYVYKEDLDDPTKLWSINIYPVFMDLTRGYSSDTTNVVPDFLMEEFTKLIDRADRAIANCDLPALMSGEIFSDMGVAILRGYESRHVNLLRHISVVRRVIQRNMEANAYMLEVETQRQEGPKGADVYGTYRDMSYVVVEQIGQKFVITDWIVMRRQMQTEPDINPDNAVTKRLVALNLAGEVSNETQTEVESLLNSLYLAVTNKVLRGPYQISDTVTLERGMYDCFNSNPEMLSSERLEKLNSQIRAMVVRHGTQVPAQMTGRVTEWIGGANNQVEFFTEELITFTGRNDGIYLTCYYLVSNMEDSWVIDDIQILSEDEHSGPTLESDKIRFSEPSSSSTSGTSQINTDNQQQTTDDSGNEVTG